MEITELLILLISIARIKAKNYEETEFSVLPNIYMEYLGEVRFFHETYNIISYFNLDELTVEESEILKSLNFVDYHCAKNCSETGLIKKLYSQFETIRQDKYKLFSAIGVPNLIRQKRGIFDFVGKISKILFGTMSEDDATYYNSEIDAVHKDNKRIGELFRNQTYILQLTLQKTEQSLKDNDNKLAQINSNFQNIDKNIQILAEKEEIIERNSLITETCLEIELALIEFNRNVGMFIQAIIFAKFGQINPQLLTPDSLMSSIKLIRDERGANEMPIVIQNGNYFEYLEVSEITISVIEYRFVYIIKIPILEIGDYKAYRTIPAPKLIKSNLLAYISNPHDYIITNNEKLLYTPSDEHFLNTCKKHKSHHFCRTIHPKYYIQSHDTCLSKIVNEPTKINKNDCDIKMITTKQTIWVQFKSNNRWLYSAPTPQSIKIICDDTVENKIINGTKILWISPGCSAVSNDVILNSHIEKNYDNNKAFIPIITYNFSEHFQLFDDPSLNLSLIKIHTIETPDVKIEDLTKYGTKLSEISREAIEIGNHERTQTTYEKFINWGTYVLYALVVLVILFLINKFKIFKMIKELRNGVYDLCCTYSKKKKLNKKYHSNNELPMGAINHANSISSELNYHIDNFRQNHQLHEQRNKVQRSKLRISEFEDIAHN
ncbi:uncharacterized protein LOC130678162 isoform X3 [Microplitis mediator]|uniref:uncharacterized protein LOC130678162 isoform X3 n=1 Tax=Microplitis mediator TaxID=375433 RepID=UPI00255763D4|nr:uncharacterized protein LOC130678162 isoform X3 [Microplitis mediator]